MNPAQRRRTIAGVQLASFALIFESSAFIVALPAVAAEWRASFTTIQWMADVSLLATAALLLPAGRFADGVGTRRVMRAGLLGVAMAACAVAFAWSTTWLIAARLALGACAAFVVPGTLALLRISVPDAGERRHAITWWSGIAVAGSAVGPLVGGGIVDAWTWRAVEALPVCALLLAWRLLRPASSDVRAGVATNPNVSANVNERLARSARPAMLDSMATLALIGNALMTYALIASRSTPPARTGATFGFGAFAAVMSLRRTRHVPPLLPQSLASDVAFLASNLASAGLYFGVYGLSFAIATGLPAALATSTWQRGMYMAPPAIVMLVLASPVGRLSARGRGWLLATLGAAVSTLGFWLLSVRGPEAEAFHVLSVITLIGAGFAASLGPLDTVMMQRASAEESNAASAFGHMTARLAGAIAIAAGGVWGLNDAEAASNIDTAGFTNTLRMCAAASGLACLTSLMMSLRSR